MLSLKRAVKPSDIRNFASRNGGYATIEDLFKGQGSNGNKPKEQESSWLVAKGGSGGRLQEQWGTYLASKGYTTGSLRERMIAFMKNGTQA